MMKELVQVSTNGGAWHTILVTEDQYRVAHAYRWAERAGYEVRVLAQ